MADTAPGASEGLLPEPNPTDTIRNLMAQRERNAISRRRVVLVGLVSIGLHLFLLPFLLTLTVNFEEQLFSPVVVGTSDHQDNGNSDPGWETDLDRDLAVSGVGGVAVASGDSDSVQASEFRVVEVPENYIVEDSVTGKRIEKQRVVKVVSYTPQTTTRRAATPGAETIEWCLRNYFATLSKMINLSATVLDEDTGEYALPEWRKLMEQYLMLSKRLDQLELDEPEEFSKACSQLLRKEPGLSSVDLDTRLLQEVNRLARLLPEALYLQYNRPAGPK